MYLSLSRIQSKETLEQQEEQDAAVVVVAADVVVADVVAVVADVVVADVEVVTLVDFEVDSKVEVVEWGLHFLWVGSAEHYKY